MQPLRWSELPAAMKALRIAVITGWLATLLAFGAFHVVSDPARYQPSMPDSVYKHQIGSTRAPRFTTDEQYRIYSVARPLGLALWSLTALAMGLAIFFERRLCKRKKKEAMDRVLGRFS
jgi:hypothetical protein